MGPSGTTGGSVADTTGDAMAGTSGAGTSTSEAASDGMSDPDPSDGSGAFVMQPDGGAGGECDPREQDCTEGEKCTAWSNNGGTWNANRCVPQMGNQQPGDTCTIEGSEISGYDDCAEGAICLFPDERNVGVCIGFCQGSAEACRGGAPCIVANDGVLPLCLQPCDPLLQDCEHEGLGCYDSPDGVFVCFADASGSAGLDGDPCSPTGENTCDPGLWCGSGSSGCPTEKCCTPYCDLSAPDCAVPDECVSYYGDPASAPPGFEDVGVCVLP